MNIEIRQIRKDESEINAVKDFLFNQIDKEYHIGPTPKFHYDIFDLEDYYLVSDKSNFFVAADGGKIVATAAIDPTIGILNFSEEFILPKILQAYGD